MGGPSLARLRSGEIDAALRQWDGRIQQVDENLLALENLDVVQRLKGQGYYPPLVLEGLTKTRVEPAIATLDEIFAQRTAIVEVLDQARALRQNLGRWPSERDAARDRRVTLRPLRPADRDENAPRQTRAAYCVIERAAVAAGGLACAHDASIRRGT